MSSKLCAAALAQLVCVCVCVCVTNVPINITVHGASVKLSFCFHDWFIFSELSIVAYCQIITKLVTMTHTWSLETQMEIHVHP
jgi:hypothetical protein